MTLECYRSRTWEDFELRWVLAPCRDKRGLCVVDPHRLGVLGFDFGGEGGSLWRWLIVSELIDEGEAKAEEVMEDLAEHAVKGWEAACAAFGLPWERLSPKALGQQADAFNALSPEGIEEMHEQGVSGLIALRRLLGPNVAAVPPLLEQMGRYRENLGGTYQEGFNAAAG